MAGTGFLFIPEDRRCISASITKKKTSFSRNKPYLFSVRNEQHTGGFEDGYDDEDDG